MLGFCAAAHAGGFAGGTGDKTDPYQIATAEQLISIVADPNLLNEHYVLIADIDLGRSRVFTKPLIGEGQSASQWFGGTLNERQRGIDSILTLS
jgi:hypothetical protein